MKEESVFVESPFTVCSYNIWTWSRWPERRDALRSFVSLHRPDVFCVQEVQRESRAVIDEALASSHERVDGEEEGWTSEGNIWWNRERFDLVEFGAEEVEICEPLRRLFWVRLIDRSDAGRRLLVSTAHWTWHGHLLPLLTTSLSLRPTRSCLRHRETERRRRPRPDRSGRLGRGRVQPGARARLAG